MGNHNFVICDPDFKYSKRLQQQLKQIDTRDFSFYLFHSIEGLIEFSSTEPVHILLVANELPSAERKKMKADQVFFLIEKEYPEMEMKNSYILKYQSASTLYREIFQIKQNNIEGVKIDLQKNEVCKLVGIYSPIDRIGKTRFAIQLGKECGKERPVLYINMEEYAGDTYFPGKLKANLGNLLYFAQQGDVNLGIRLSTIVGQMGSLDYVEPIYISQDLKQVPLSEWLLLFERIMEEGIYEMIILDLSPGIQGLYDILRKCHTVYTHYIDEPVSMSKLKSYTNNLIHTGYADVLEHTIQKQVKLT